MNVCMHEVTSPPQFALTIMRVALVVGLTSGVITMPLPSVSLLRVFARACMYACAFGVERCFLNHCLPDLNQLCERLEECYYLLSMTYNAIGKTNERNAAATKMLQCRV